MIVLQMEDLKYLFERLDKLEQRFDQKLEQILVQTTKTNGRVSAMENIVTDQGDDLESAKKTIGFNKGRDYVIIGLIGVFGGLIVSYTIGGGREKDIERAIEKYKIENNIK
jgi:hypothetical protein